jgi:hypothetical protein
MVVNLEGVPAAMAYGWGIEAGCFMVEVRQGEAEGTQVFHAGNMGMIEMICAEAGMDVDILGSENEHLLCRVKKRPCRLSLVKGGKR